MFYVITPPSKPGKTMFQIRRSIDERGGLDLPWAIARTPECVAACLLADLLQQPIDFVLGNNCVCDHVAAALKLANLPGPTAINEETISDLFTSWYADIMAEKS